MVQKPLTLKVLRVRMSQDTGDFVPCLWVLEVFYPVLEPCLRHAPEELSSGDHCSLWPSPLKLSGKKKKKRKFGSIQ